MEDEKKLYKDNGLSKCTHCPCCFCNDNDLKRHIDEYGHSKIEHAEEFRRVHNRIEHSTGSNLE